LSARGFSISAVLQSRWAEALGAAGCAAFFVSLFALSLEWRLEQSRSLRLPELRVLVPLVGARPPAWALAPSEPDEAKPFSLEVARERAPARADQVASTQAAPARISASASARARTWMVKLTERLMRAKRLSWAGLAPVTQKPATPILVHQARPKAIRAQLERLDTQPAVVTQAQHMREPPREETKSGMSTQSSLGNHGRLGKFGDQEAPSRPALQAPAAIAVVAPPPTPNPQPLLEVVERAAPPAPVQALAAPVARVQESAPVPSDAQPQASGPRAPRPSQALQLSGWIAANTQIQFSTRPSRVTFTDSEGHTEEVSVGLDGRVVSPAGSAGVLDYSFRAWLDRPTQRPAPVVVALAPSSEAGANPTLAATFWSPESSGGQLDFREGALTELRLRGQVFEADAAQAQGVAGAEVGLVGSPERVAITDADGRFDLGDLRVAAGGRAFLEARRPDGFKHRFAVEASDQALKKGQQLFIFSEQQIAQWQSALEGGLSPQSGWIVGAFASSEMSQELRPEITAPQARSKISPETYALGPENQLAPLGPTQSSSRWLSVEIPSGAARVRLLNPEGRAVRELWEPISPGVINVIRVDRER
jgi:hypothetical protein